MDVVGPIYLGIGLWQMTVGGYGRGGEERVCRSGGSQVPKCRTTAPGALENKSSLGNQEKAQDFYGFFPKKVKNFKIAFVF
jgi:hypothetical protein